MTAFVNLHYSWKVSDQSYSREVALMIRTLLLIAAVVLCPGSGESAPPIDNIAAKQAKAAQI